MRRSVPWFAVLCLAAVAAAALLGALLYWRGAEPAPAGVALPRPAPREAPVLAFFDMVVPPQPSPAPPVRREQLAAMVQLADHTYCRYLESSRYPPGSRPAGEQPDQLDPTAPVTEQQPMRLQDGGSEPSVRIDSSQSRVRL
ncbi:MAG: hypothetical protein ABIT83_00995, partial [Massilia sp.]